MSGFFQEDILAHFNQWLKLDLRMGSEPPEERMNS